MMNFQYFLSEAKKTSKPKTDEESFQPGDTAGKVWEILKGKAHNNGKFADDFRVEGKKPEDIHNIMAEKMFGKQFANHPIYNNMRNSANESAEMTERFLSGSHNHDRNKGFRRVAWTSQDSDPSSYMGREVGKSVADNMADLSHGASHALSEKVTAVGSPVNYANPGAKSFEKFAELKPGTLSAHNSAYQQVLDKHTKHMTKDFIQQNGENKERYIKRITRSKNPETELTPKEQKARKEILAAYGTRNNAYANSMRAGLNQMIADDKKDGGTRLRDSIMDLVTPSRETPTTVTHTELNPDGTAHRHKVYDVHDHINQYLDHFGDFRVVSDADNATVTIHGTHKTEKDRDGNPLSLPVARLAIYGEKHLGTPRGSTVLPSENHPSIKYKGELDTAGINGDSFDQHAKGVKKERQPSEAEQQSAIAAQTPEHRKNTQGVVNWLTSNAPGVGGRNIRSFSGQSRPASSGGFAAMPRPGIKRPPPSQRLSTTGWPEHMHQGHKDNSIGGHQDSGI